MLNVNEYKTRIVTGKCRFAYVNLLTPRAAQEGQRPRYSLCLLVKKEDKETIGLINKAIEGAMKLGTELWGGEIPEGVKTPIRDGDIERPDREEFRGHYFINASSKSKPGVVDSSLVKIVDPEEVYSGCYGRASINFYPFNQGGNKGVGCGLQNVQKIEDGESLYNLPKPEEDFKTSEIDFLR